MKSVIGTVATAPATAPALKGMPSFDVKAVSFCPISVRSILLLKTLPISGSCYERHVSTMENVTQLIKKASLIFLFLSEVPIWARAARKFEIISLASLLCYWLATQAYQVYTLRNTYNSQS